jgi:NAD(P)-dependent dehydrogenase (short-subunit alcohol dehydrogenase family)
MHWTHAAVDRTIEKSHERKEMLHMAATIDISTASFSQGGTAATPAARPPQTALVTGGATGIGYAIAEQFLARGANVVLNGRTQAKLVKAAERLGRASRVAIVAGDITQLATADRIVQASVERFGRLDVLVNNAGIFHTKPFTDYGIEELDAFLAYLRGTFVLSQAAVRQMRLQEDGGAIINISTILALNGVAAFPSSAPMAAKGGITALTKNLSIELAADNIRINAVAPGVVPTPLYGELSDEQLNALHAMQPLGRYGTPKDVADAVLYLANATWVTGVILPVDGGVDAGGDGSSRRSRSHH